MSDLVFVDTETTGLDPERHEVWDIAIIEEDGTEHEWHVHPRALYRADENELRVTHYYERVAAAGTREVSRKEGYPEKLVTRNEPAFWTPRVARSIAYEIATLTANKHIVGAVPSFDVPFLRAFMAEEGAAACVPAWHYHLIDVETMGVGYLTAMNVEVELPWSSEKISQALRVDPSAYERHTALGDARWVKAQYEAIINGGAKIGR